MDYKNQVPSDVTTPLKVNKPLEVYCEIKKIST